MMRPLSNLSGRIHSDLSELTTVQARIIEAWQRYKTTSDDYYLDSVALNLHDLYSGLERIFELVAIHIDGKKPTGENWHKALLQQMASENAPLRPALISNLVSTRLDVYRGFRHVVRNVYAYKFDPNKVAQLVDELPDLFVRLQAELQAFADFLNTQF